LKLLDPGLPQVRQYLTSVVMDVVNRYDVDGVHFDDYFYPYPDNAKGFSGITAEDNATFANYSRSFTNRGDWRRDNVNSLIKMIHDSIQTVKPYVKFGISPFGIWKNGVPSGIVGLDAYNTIYCDALAWLRAQTIDYLTPQLYWRFGGNQDYGKLMPWWASQVNGRHLYPGLAPFNISLQNWAANELPRQIRANRGNVSVQGNVFFRALTLWDNPKGFNDSLKTTLYRYPALSPVMTWKETVSPNVPQNLRYERIAGAGATGLRWDAPAKAADGDTAFRYVVYRLNIPVVQPADLNDVSKIVAIAGLNFNFPKTPASNTPVYYAVTALDRNSNESLPTTVIMISPPAMAILTTPANGAIVGSGGLMLRWNYSRNAAFYQLQVARDSMFAALLVNETGLVDTFKVISGLEGQTTYYWRVQASNAGGGSAFSPKNYFTTGFPVATTQVSPLNNVRDVALGPTFVWRPARGASAYQLQIASNSSFDSNALIYDFVNLADTSYKIAQLEINKFYFWRVRAKNAFGESNWALTWRFKTIETTGMDGKPTVPATFALYQNYPNPFNRSTERSRRSPTTTILFELPKPGLAQLIIYDGLGQEVATLLNEVRPAGRQEVNFYAYDFPSGIYYYRLKFEGQVLTRRMTILK